MEVPDAVFRAADVEREQLRTLLRRGLAVRVFRGVYRDARCEPGPALLARALGLVLPEDAVISGHTAAWLHGHGPSSARDHVPEAVVPRGCCIPRRRGLRVREALVPDREVSVVAGLRVTSPARTVLDVARRPGDLTEAVVVADALLQRGRCTRAELAEGLTGMRRWRGVAQARAVVEHAEPLAESPGETRLRMALVLGGLPRPEAQLRVTRPDGSFAARCDLAYPDVRLLLEYDGVEVHGPDQLAADLTRQNLLFDLGWHLRRFTGFHVRHRQRAIVASVGALLAAAA